MSEHDETCRLVDEHMSEVLEGSADAALLEHIADCETCRDARFDAERSLATLRVAGADYVPPKNLEQRLLAALAGRPEDVAGRAEDTSGVPLEQALPLPGAPKAVQDAAKPVADTEKPVADAAKPVTEAQKPKQVVRTRWAAWVGAATLAAGLAVWWRHAPDRKVEAGTQAAGWSGKVSQIASGFGSTRGLEICDASGSDCVRAKLGQAIAAGAHLRTDGLTRAKLALSDGSALYLDRATEFRLSADTARQGKLVSGNLVADVEKLAGRVARIELPLGRADVLGTKFALQAGDDFARVDVSRGEVRLVDSQERSVSVLAGEGGELSSGKAPTAGAVASLEAAMAWSEEAFVENSPNGAQGLRGLGELVAKKPGEQRERDGAVRLSRHDVKVRVVNNIAKTTVEEVFSNTTNEVLEGIFRFPLPPDAQIERLALEVDGELMEGAFVERERAGKIWRGAIVNATQKAPEPTDDIIWVPGRWKDPALLEWQRGGRFELRIFPIPKQGSRRIVLAYTQRLAPHGSVRRYTYPLAYDPSGSTTVGQFSVDVEVRGHDPEFGVHAQGYALGSGPPSQGKTVLSYKAQGFVPSGDLALEYRLAGAERELRAWAYMPSSADVTRTKTLRPDPARAGAAVAAGTAPADAPYVALSLRPQLPRWVQGQRRAFVLALDTSRSMYGEHFQRALDVVERTVHEMDHEDRVTVLACDTACRALPGGFTQPGPNADAAVRRFLEGQTPEGASDLVNTLVEASALKREVADRAFRVVYVGDGAPTVGSVLPSFISRELKQRLPAGISVHAVTVGADADLGAIEAATEAGGGVVVPYAPGQSAVSVAFAVLGAAYGNSLEHVSLELPPGLVEVAPQRLGSIASGSEALVVARMLTSRLAGKVRLRGKVGGQSYEQSYPLELEATSGAGNAFVPRLFAATRIAELGRSPLAEARDESVQLSRAFSVASRYTSLLVLESPAMFEAFGLDTTRAAPEWSGEDNIAESEADGEVRAQALPSPEPSPAPPPRAKPSVRKAAEPLAGIGSGAGRSAAANDAMDPFGDARLQRVDRERRWIPMRRVWDRTARIHLGDQPLKGGSPEAVARARARVEQNPLSRAARKELYIAQFLAGALAEAQETAERWSEKDPMDPEALTARADVAAQRGDRNLAIRLLGSVIDMRPDDHKAQWRLARLQRWRGEASLGCRYSSAVGQMYPSDLERVTLALRCARAIGDAPLFEALRSMAPTTLRGKLDQALAKTPAEDEISGDFRLEASWEGDGDDVDLVIVHPDGFRVSWLGAPTRAIISARDVLSMRSEGLGLRGAKAGSYAIEVVRDAAGVGTVTGDIKLTVGNQVRTLPFTLTNSRVRVATVDLSFTSRLVPVTQLP